MKLFSHDLIEEYYEKVKQEYPDITLKQVEDICQAPFVEVRAGIESGLLPTIRLKFFGTFLAYPKRVAAILKGYEVQFKEHRITPAFYFKKKELLENYLKKHKNEME
jgi:hypothetical protein